MPDVALQPEGQAVEALILQWVETSVADERAVIEAALRGRVLERYPNPEALAAHCRDLHKLHLFKPDLTQASELQADPPEFMKQPPSRAFKAIDAILGNLFAMQLWTLVAPNSALKPAIEEIFNKGVWRLLPQGSASQKIIMRLYAKMWELRGQLVSKYVTESPQAQTGMSPVARLEYARYAQIANVTNQLFIQWEREDGTVLSTAQRRTRGFTNQFAVIRLQAEEPVEVPWHQAYPEETTALARHYDDLADALWQASCYPNKVQYYRAVATAWRTSLLEDWLRADTLYVQQTADHPEEAIHLHTMERGFGLDEIQRMPEASLRFPDADFKAVDEAARQTRADMALMMRRFFEAHTDLSSEMQGTLALMERSVYSARHFMGAGWSMIFKSAGQILPNEPRARAEGGISVSASPQSNKDSYTRVQAGFQAIYGNQASLPDIPIEDLAGRANASHEFFHPIGVTPGLLKRVDFSFVKAFVEEYKASLGRLVLAYYMPYLAHQQGWPENAHVKRITIDDLRYMVLHYLQRSGRFPEVRDEEWTHRYLRKHLMFIKIMEEVGIIEIEKDEPKLRLDDHLILAFYECLLHEQLPELLSAYDRGGPYEFKAFLRTHLKPTRSMDYLYEKAEERVEKSGLFTAQSLCQLSEAA